MTFHRFIRESKLTLALAAPIVVGQVGQHLMGLVDSVMLGQVGVIPLAASAFALSIFIIVIVALLGILTPVSVLASRSFGAEQNEESAKILRHGLWIAVVLGFGGALILTGCMPFLKSMGQSEEVAHASGPFLMLLAWSLVPVLVFQVLKNYCEALSSPIPPMMMMIGGVALNVVLNWVMIFGNLGCPPLGLVGAGLATFIARFAICFALIIYVLSARRFRGHLPVKWLELPEWSRIVSMLKLGFPIGGQLLVEVGAFALGAIMVGWISAEALAAHQIVINCAAVAFMIPVGISMAASIRIGHHVGAKKCKHLRSIGLSSYAVTLVLMSITCTIFLVGGRTIAGAFIADAVTVALAVKMFAAAGIFQIADGIQAVGMGLLRGLHDVTKPLIIAVVSYWGLMLPCGYVLAFHTSLGAVGMWYGFIAGLAFAAVFLTFRFLWKTSSKRVYLII